MLRVLISAWPHFLARHEGSARSQIIEVAARVETMLVSHSRRAASKGARPESASALGVRWEENADGTERPSSRIPELLTSNYY